MPGAGAGGSGERPLMGVVMNMFQKWVGVTVAKLCKYTRRPLDYML